MSTGLAVKSIRAVERAIDVLRCFRPDDRALSVTEIQKRVKLSRPTLYRLLHTLESKGLVSVSGDPQRFALDYGVAELAGAWLGRVDVAGLAKPHLAALWEATDETVALFVPTSALAKICVEELQSRQPLTFTRGAGFTEPVTVGSSGKVMLAFMDPVDIAAALSHIDDGQARAALKAELVEIRRQGYAISAGEIIGGAIAIAAPAFDSAGAIAASVCVFGPEARIHGAGKDGCIRQVCRTAARISDALGRRSPGTAAEAAE